jgi:N-ethylmaleimide reductase
MKDLQILTPYKLDNIMLSSRTVMSPMTRCRAIGNVPNELMVTYYTQRSSAGLIVTEGVAPSPNGLGYARIPGLFNQSQVDGWKKVTDAVHLNGGKIFAQLMHTGRISHMLNMPQGAQILAPSAVKPAGQMWTDAEQMQDFPVPKAMSEDEIALTKAEYVSASKNAMEAGFDGVELHGANGYLLEQFLSPVSNIRTDNYGGSIENRCRFVLEVVSAVAESIGKEKTAIRLSPYGVASDMPHYPEIDATYTYMAEQLDKTGIVYIHIVDHSAMGAPEVPRDMKRLIRDIFQNTIILSGGYDLERAEADIAGGLGNMVAFGRPFINNPDLVNRFQNNLPLSQDLKMDLFYSADEVGYTDYPNH